MTLNSIGLVMILAPIALLVFAILFTVWLESPGTVLSVVGVSAWLLIAVFLLNA